MVKAVRITVRQPGTGKSLYHDPNVGWRWCGAGGRATPMTREQAELMASRLGGVVCENGVPVGATLPKRPADPEPKRHGRGRSSELVAAMARQDWATAFRLAISLPRLGPVRTPLERGRDALLRPDFYRQVGLDPARLVADAVDALKQLTDKRRR